MSQAVDQTPPLHEGEEEEEETERKTSPLLALAPDASLQEESLTQSPTDDTASSAFQCLDELSTGIISGDKIAMLKRSFSLLHNTLKRSQESEIKLLQEAKRCRAELVIQQAELEKTERITDGSDSEVKQLTEGLDSEFKQLMNIQEDLREAEEREDQMIYQLECLKEERRGLEAEYETQLKPVELANHSRSLKESTEELRKELAQRRLEVQSLKEDMEARQQLMACEHKELDDMKDIIKKNEAKLALLLSVPGQLGKEIERINRRKTEMEKRLTLLDEQLSEVAVQQEKMEACCRSLEEEKREVMREVERGGGLRVAAEREKSMLTKEREMAKEKELILLEQRGMLDLNTSHCVVERKSVHESLAQKQREHDRQLRELKKLELQLKMAGDALVHTQQQHENTRALRDDIPTGDELLKQRQELQFEVEKLKRKLINQHSVLGGETQLATQSVQQEQDMIRESYRRREDVQSLRSLTQIKADEREQKARELRKAEQRYSRFKQDMRGKQLVIQEHKKQHQEIQARLSVFAKLYESIKEERNKCLNLIQMGSQRAIEMRECFKILENEREILRTQSINKEKLLQKFRLKHIHSLTIRDSLKKDISKVALVLNETREKQEEQTLNLAKLTQMINYQEQKLLQMRKSQDIAVQSRNDRGVQLLEREEETCIFYEKVNVQQSQIREGNIEMQALEEEMHSLQMAIAEERRQIALSKNQVPFKRSLEEESTMLQIQLSECKDQMLELEKTLQDPVNVKRFRRLEGNDPSPVELVQKIEQLEGRLAELEEQLLEKDLTSEQVTRLSQCIIAKAEKGKQDRLELTKKVNELQGRIKDSTREMMAVVSELSMRQASAIVLQQELKERELFLDTCYRRLEQGLPPSEDLEMECQHILREERRRLADQQERDRILKEEEESQLPSGVYTTAEARPNAYIPVGDTLPLPKPYGAMAPFKPSEPGSNIRHIRKPEPKPIEI
ncbi:hypothetical protein UPYG_G00249400 [Umbra pygmaea]|uniref:Coiled-coil domain-containing protein 146 n=1 Tax=Umbra pygmaea TaxID=75934 RepID=A0ABD0WBK3_UMBPY